MPILDCPIVGNTAKWGLSFDEDLHPKESKPITLNALEAEKELFDFLVNQWHQERGGISSPSRMFSCGSYQMILSLPHANRFIHEELRQNLEKPDFWFPALRSIYLGDGPNIPSNEKGNFKKLAQKWVEWLDARKY